MRDTFVTGSSGFLGRNLVSRFDDFTAVPHEDILHTNFKDAKNVYFLSAYGNLANHTDVNEIIEANVVDLVDVLEGINPRTIKSFVYISTSSVKLKVQTMYSRTKRAAEEILLAYMEKYNLPVTIIRPFSITGVGEQPQHLIPTLIRKIKSGETVELAPDPVHDFIDVQDVVEGVINLSGNYARGIFELGTGISHTNQQVLEMVEEALGKKAKVQIAHGLRIYDNEDWVCTNFRARTWGWKPKIPLRESIRRMVEEASKGIDATE